MAIAPTERRVARGGSRSAAWTPARRPVEQAVRPPRDERPLWQLVLLLYAGITVLAAVVMLVAFAAAHALA